MIFCTRNWETDQIFAHVENNAIDVERNMTFQQGVSGNPHGNRHRTRHLLNQEFMQALLLNFRHQGKKAIEKVARNQPGVYLKILVLLVPRETKFEHSGGVKAMTDEQIERSIEIIKAMIAERDAGCECQGDRGGSGSRPELAGARKRRHQDAQGLRSASPKVLEAVRRHFGVPDRMLDVLVPEVVL
jgi:hypothetical protein